MIMIKSAPRAKTSWSASICFRSRRADHISASCRSNSEPGEVFLPLRRACLGSFGERSADNSLRLIFPLGAFGISGTI